MPSRKEAPSNDILIRIVGILIMRQRRRRRRDNDDDDHDYHADFESDKMIIHDNEYTLKKYAQNWPDGFR